MKIRLTARGQALVNRLGNGTKKHRPYKPNFRKFTLIRVDGTGKALSKEKITVDINKVFKAA